MTKSIFTKDQIKEIQKTIRVAAQTTAYDSDVMNSWKIKRTLSDLVANKKLIATIFLDVTINNVDYRLSTLLFSRTSCCNCWINLDNDLTLSAQSKIKKELEPIFNKALDNIEKYNLIGFKQFQANYKKAQKEAIEKIKIQSLKVKRADFNDLRGTY